MGTITFIYPQTLQALVTRTAEVKLKIAEVRRRKAKDYQRPDVPVDAGVAVSHLHLLEAVIENIDLDIDLGAVLEPIAGSTGRFKSTEPSIEPTIAETEGTVAFRGIFETVIVLEELIDRINKLFDQADRQREDERRRAEEAYHYGEDCRIAGCRKSA